MFMRQHRINGTDYVEVLESYRDPVTGKPKHRLVVRWRAEHGVDVGHLLWVAKVLRRRAVIRRNAQEAWVFKCKQEMASPLPSPEYASALVRAERRLQRDQRKLEVATRFLAGVTEAEAGLVRSGKLPPPTASSMITAPATLP